MKNEGCVDVVDMRTDDMFKEQCEAFNNLCDLVKLVKDYFSKLRSWIIKYVSVSKYILYIFPHICFIKKERKKNKIIKEQCEKIEKQESKIRELEEKEKELNKIKEDMNNEKTLLNDQREKIKNDLQRERARLEGGWCYALTEKGAKILTYFGFGNAIYKTRALDLRYIADICVTEYNDFENQIDTNTADKEFLDKIRKYDEKCIWQTVKLQNLA